MGSPHSKPVSPHQNRLRDSVVLNDGLPPLKLPKYAGSPDGRFLFVLGDKHKTSEPIDWDDHPWDWDDFATSFKLDVIDLFLGKRVRIEHVGDLYGLSDVWGFYALDERTVVIIDLFDDYDDVPALLTHRIIQIDVANRSADCWFHRVYTFPQQEYPVKLRLAMGDKHFVATCEDRSASEIMAGIVYPIDPLSQMPKMDITPLIEEANDYLAGKQAQLAPGHSPFFISDTVLAFFVSFGDCINPMYILEMNLETEEVVLKQTSGCTASSQRAALTRAESAQAANGEVAMISYFHRSRVSWQSFAILNARTLQWADIEVNKWSKNDKLVPLRGGQFVIASMTSISGSTRLIGDSSCEQEIKERFRLVGNPLRIHSLVELATIATQRYGRLTSKELEQIADRML